MNDVIIFNEKEFLKDLQGLFEKHGVIDITVDYDMADMWATLVKGDNVNLGGCL